MRFLWGEGGDEEHNKVAWVSWEDICSSKESDGLGVKILLCLMRHFWKNGGGNFSTKTKGLWVKRGLLGGGNSSRESFWWKDLKRVCGSLNGERWFDKDSEWKLDDGGKMKFWVDDWVNGQNLASLFHRLFLLSDNKDASVRHMGRWCNDVRLWEIT
ncbi:hypothetical protein HKD37_16G045913 [Glycine soja]